MLIHSVSRQLKYHLDLLPATGINYWQKSHYTRIDWRFNDSNVPFETQNPILLPKSSIATTLLILQLSFYSSLCKSAVGARYYHSSTGYYHVDQSFAMFQMCNLCAPQSDDDTFCCCVSRVTTQRRQGVGIIVNNWHSNYNSLYFI